MGAMMRIDPHAHTICSDGTQPPRELVRSAQEAGLDIVGICDHDTLEGWEEAASAALELGVGLIRGAEISAAHEGLSVHVLAFLPDPTNPDFRRILHSARNSRAERLEEMAARLAVDYPLLSWESVQARAYGAPLGRPHLADELVEKGYFADRSAAFSWALHTQGPYYVHQKIASPVEVVRVIRGAGGVPVLAHPRAYLRGRILSEDRIAEMAEAGLYGLERDHRDHDAAGRADVDRISTRLGLAITGGSDYHGSGKPNALGENLLSPRVLAEIEEQGSIPVVGGKKG